MKKAIFTLLIIFSVFAVANAQEMVSKKGTPILPEAGDYAIGINAVPFFNYAGNLLNGCAFNASPTWTWINNQVITGKYFVDANTAYRFKLRLGLGSANDKKLVADQTATTTPAQVEDKMTISHTDVVLGLGLEKRRGKGRVQGIYGAEAQILLAMGKTKYTYGNAINATYNAPLSYCWVDNVAPLPVPCPGAGLATTRVTENKAGMTLGVGARAFVGVEYFFAPKISLGGEFGWGLNFTSTGKGKKTEEGWMLNTTAAAVGTLETETGGSGAFGIDTDNPYAAINIMFYF